MVLINNNAINSNAMNVIDLNGCGEEEECALKLAR
jgi:hypothetical protein